MNKNRSWLAFTFVMTLLPVSGCGLPAPFQGPTDGRLRALKGSGDVGRELEVRVELTAEGFRKLSAQGGWSSVKVREDCYFDAFDGRDWAWRRLADTWKLRVKKKSKGFELQLRHAIARVGADTGLLPVTATLWERWEDTPDDPVDRFLWQPSGALLAMTRAGQIPDARTCRHVHEAWSEQSWKGQSALQRALVGIRGVLLPTHTASKARQEQSVTLAHGESCTIVIGRSTTLDALGATVDRYEVEASPDQADTDTRIVRRDVESWLAARGLKASDTTTTPSDAAQAAARAYAVVPGLVP